MSRNLRSIDLETTGLSPQDEIVEIGTVDIDLDNGDLSNLRSSLINPGIPIPADASAVHHITDEMVKTAGDRSTVLPKFTGADAYLAHNIRYEQMFLKFEQPLICTYRLAVCLCPKAPNFELQTLRYFLDLPVDEALASPPHRALPDAYVAAVLFVHFLELVSFEQAIEVTKNPIILPRITFGKHRGSPFSDLPSAYLRWIIDQQDMDEDVLYTARHHLGGANAPTQQILI